ncbi:MAG: choice-of-anchor D domain-containing protein [Pirellulales bacterium]|nr:choice-of-anchor D domain-containing protein [Pirellulales bacterium]
MSSLRTKFLVASLLSLAMCVATERASAIPLTFIDGGGDDQSFTATITATGGVTVSGQINFTLRTSLGFLGNASAPGNININPQFSAISLTDGINPGPVSINRNPTGSGTLTLASPPQSLQNAVVSNVTANLLGPGGAVPLQSNTISFNGDGNITLIGINFDLSANVQADLTGQIGSLTYQQTGSNMFNAPGTLAATPPNNFSTNYLIDSSGSGGNLGGALTGDISGNANLNIAGLFNTPFNLGTIASINEVLNEAIPTLAGTGSIQDLEPGVFSGPGRDIRTTVNPSVPSFIPLAFNFAATSVENLTQQVTNIDAAGATWTAWISGVITFNMGIDITVSGLDIKLQDTTADALQVPVLTTTPSAGGTLNFGNVLVGTAQNGNLTVQNLGTNGSVISGTFPNGGGEFSPLSFQAFGPIAANTPGETRVYTYTPTGRGADTLNRTITSDSGSAPVQFAGRGVAPVSAATGGDAGYVLVGTSGNAISTVTNNGDGNLSGLGAVSNLNGTASGGGGEFVLSGPAGISLLDHTSTNLNYTYTPTSRGADSQNITHGFSNGNPSGNNTAHNQTVTVTGQGVAPVSAATGAAVNTPGAYTLVGTTGQATATVTNNGDGNLSGLGAVSNLNGTASGGAGEFSLNGSNVISLPDHTSQNLVYDYNPTARGADSENITHVFTNGSPDGTNSAHNLQVTLTGQGVAPLAAAAGGAVSVPGAYTLVGTTGQVITSVTNNGDGNLSGLGAISNLNGTLSGGAGEFSLSSPAVVSVPDHTTINPVYDYNPTARGADSENLVHSFTNGNPDGTNTAVNLQINVTGQGVAPLTTPVDQSANNAGFILVGTSGTASVSMTNNGDGNLSGLGAVSNLNGTLPTTLGEFNLTSSPTPLGTISVPDHTTHTYSYTYTPTGRGADSENGLMSFTNGSPDGTNQATSEAYVVQGQGVAPVQATSSVDAPLTRITYLTPGPGNTNPPSVTVHNNGDGNLSGLGAVSNLNGTIDTGTDARFTGGGAAFSLTDHTNVNYAINYQPTTHTIDSSTFTVSFSNGSADGTNQAQVVPVTVSGQGVGPIFNGLPYDTDNNPAPGNTLDFGSVVIGANGQLQLDISNITTDPNGGDPTLTDMTLISATITGPDAVEFSLPGFVPGTVISAGGLISYFVNFDPLFPPGIKTATLTFLTDEDAVFGMPGNSYSFTLVGLAAPEPASVLGFALCTIGGVVAYRLRRRR